MWGLETEPQSKLTFIDGHFILVTRWEDQREKTLFDNHYHGNIFYVWEHYFVLKVLPCFFHSFWKCLWKVEVYLLVRLNLSRLSIIHSRSKFNFLKQFLCQGERFREISFFLYVLGNSMYKRICPNLDRQFCCSNVCLILKLDISWVNFLLS